MSAEDFLFKPVGTTEASTPDGFVELPSPANSTPQVQVHPRYYLKDDMTVLLVEDKVYPH